ncbi:MAG: substrate-binding domain-containing protein [Planctomycetaceae bacterium]
MQASDMQIGQLAAEHLVSRGHRNLAFLSPKPSQMTLQRRQASFTYFAQQAGAEVTSYLGEEQNWTFPSAAVKQVELVEELVQRILNDDKPATAIFAPDDSVGALTARVLTSRGIRIGQDLSLMSCNNEQSLLMGIHPALTTIDVHAREIGRRAVDQLAWRMSNPEVPAMEIGIEPTLVSTASVCKIKSTQKNKGSQK